LSLESHVIGAGILNHRLATWANNNHNNEKMYIIV